MGRPVTLFTGQWADLPLEELAQKAAGFGYDGLELACWGDHFEVGALFQKRAMPPVDMSSWPSRDSSAGPSPTTWWDKQYATALMNATSPFCRRRSGVMARPKVSANGPPRK